MQTLKVQKRPITVEALQYHKGRNETQIIEFTSNAAIYEDNQFKLRTLEGTMQISDRDFVIKGVKGEFYPCKEDIFNETYQPSVDAYEAEAETDTCLLTTKLPTGTKSYNISAKDEYRILYTPNQSSTAENIQPPVEQYIKFQSGPVQQNGFNGIQIEDLLWVAINRIESLNKAPYQSEHNDMAVDAIRIALYALNNRTQDRINRGVEGTSTP